MATKPIRCYQINGGTCKHLVSPLNNFICAAGHRLRPSVAKDAAKVLPISDTLEDNSVFVHDSDASDISKFDISDGLSPFFKGGKLPVHWINNPIVSFPVGDLYQNLEGMASKVANILQKVNPKLSDFVKNETENFDFAKDPKDSDKLSSLLEVLLDALNQVTPPNSFAAYKTFGEEAFLIIEDKVDY
jgi:hypothetical protein